MASEPAIVSASRPSPGRYWRVDSNAMDSKGHHEEHFSRGQIDV